ncbi:DNA polymerase III subunit gamma and tau [Gordonia sp. CPCC 205515]|uniref:DNA polymerase III subunit gamma and tau n=1 Tax=Gordonia sp. CPCC 205515 TaxID=3140791 RepID=UPI003AF33DA3
MALYRTYRPATFAEVVGQEHVTDPLSRALDSGRINHAYLFSGPRGCGKTSSARILARSLNCAHGPTSTPCGTCDSCVALGPGGPGNLDVIELDAASHGGVDDTRELRDRAFYAPAESRYRVFIVDEAHMVTTAGFNALLKIVEEPPEHLIFVFATTEPEKVLPTIRSRTHHYPFRLLAPPVMRGLLERICEREQVTVAPEVYPLVIRAGGGSPRDSLSILDQLLAGASDEGVTYDRALALLGVTDIALIDDSIDALATADGAALFGAVEKMVDAGHDPRRFAIDLLERLRDLILLQAVPDAADRGLVEAPGDQLQRMQAQIETLGPASLTRYAEIVHTALGEMRGTTSPRLLLEVMCARMLLPSAASDDAALLQRLERLESGVVAPSGSAPRPAPSAQATVDGDAPPAAAPRVAAPSVTAPSDNEPPPKYVRPSQRKAAETPASTAPADTSTAPAPASTAPAAASTAPAAESTAPAAESTAPPAASTAPTPAPTAPPAASTAPAPASTAPTPAPTATEKPPIAPRGGGNPTAPQPPARVPADRPVAVDAETVAVGEKVVAVDAETVAVGDKVVAVDAEVVAVGEIDDIPLPDEPSDFEAPPEGERGAARRQAPAAPTPEPEPEPAASGGLDVESMRKRFQDVRTAVRTRSKSLEPMLSAATIHDLQDQTVVIGHPAEVLVGRLSAPHATGILRDALREVFETELDVQTIHVPPGAAVPTSTPTRTTSEPQAPQQRPKFSRPSRSGGQSGAEQSGGGTGQPSEELPPEPEPEPEPTPPRSDEELTDAERDEMVADAHSGAPESRLDPDQVALELLKSELGARPIE